VGCRLVVPREGIVNSFYYHIDKDLRLDYLQFNEPSKQTHRFTDFFNPDFSFSIFLTSLDRIVWTDLNNPFVDTFDSD
jgi:hypothetical protein